MNTRIVLVGAGSAMFGLGALGDIFKSEKLAGSTVVLHDINPTALERVAGYARQVIVEKELPYQLEATTSRREALEGADFIFISIEVGDRYALWEQDWQIPLQYGIPQVYGENGGPGGLFHSLRIIPPILEICGDIQTLCPEAYVFNLSNPLSRICHAVHRQYPELKIVGLCHEIASLPKHLPRLLETPLSNLSFQAGGLNHFSILTEIHYRDTGADAYPDVRERAPEYFAPLPERGLFQLILERFGYLPITTDSHFGEYIHWAQEVADHEGILDFYTNYKQSCLAPEMPPLKRLAQGTSEAEHWNLVPIMESIVADEPLEELAVNVPNAGFIKALPAQMIVEIPAVIDSDGVHGVTLENYPLGFAGLLQNQVAVHELTTEAVLTGSREVALQALLVDPVVNSVQAAEETLDTILRRQARYLDYIH
ncbi:MAG: alpha-glucosidase [Chloroflexota bacterium]|nr:alpha-glucosidase [Chloroflexota bacterium]